MHIHPVIKNTTWVSKNKKQTKKMNIFKRWLISFLGKSLRNNQEFWFYLMDRDEISHFPLKSSSSVWELNCFHLPATSCSWGNPYWEALWELPGKGCLDPIVLAFEWFCSPEASFWSQFESSWRAAAIHRKRESKHRDLEWIFWGREEAETRSHWKKMQGHTMSKVRARTY